MKKEVNVQRSKLLADGLLHIELLDGSSYLYSLQEIADIIAVQQSVHADVLPCGHDKSFLLYRTNSCSRCGTPATRG